MRNSLQKFKIGDLVEVKGHASRIKEITANGFYKLETKRPADCCNYYTMNELKLKDATKTK